MELDSPSRLPQTMGGGIVAQRGANTKRNNKGKDGDVTLEQRTREEEVTPQLSGESVAADKQEANMDESATSPSLYQMDKKTAVTGFLFLPCLLGFP